MVSDIAFYITLGIALFLAFTVGFIIYTIKTKFSPEMMRIMTTLHAAIFGYESALVDLIGSRGYRTHVFPEIVEVMAKLKNGQEDIMKIFDADTPYQAMKMWMDVMKDVNMIDNKSLVEDKGDGKYNLVINKCSMCHPIHEVMGQKKGICPLALIISSASSIVDKEKEPAISYSSFTPEGTTTLLSLDEIVSN
jgi:hypothetical protein